MLLKIVKTIAANTRTIFLVIVMTGIVGMIGLEMLFAYSMANAGTQELKRMVSFSENIMSSIGNIGNTSNASTMSGIDRLNFDFSNYDKLVNSTKGLNYTSGYELFNTIVGDMFNNGDK